jgi:hypothetical protein
MPGVPGLRGSKGNLKIKFKGSNFSAMKVHIFLFIGDVGETYIGQKGEMGDVGANGEPGDMGFPGQRGIPGKDGLSGWFLF